MRVHQTVLILTILTLSSMATSARAKSTTLDIQVVGLFKGAAVVSIDQQRKLMRVGDTTDDITLLAANSDKAIVQYRGRRIALGMSESESVRVGLPDTSTPKAHLMSSGEMYNVTGSINGQLTDFVVDTGASYVTMSPAQASVLRLDHSNAKKVMVNTANGKTTAHVFNVESIRVGGIELNNVKAAVIHNMSSSRILLGMSFLNQVEMTQKNGLMVLTQH